MLVLGLCAVGAMSSAIDRSWLRGPNKYLSGMKSPHPLPIKQAIAGLAAKTQGGSSASEEDFAEAAVLVSLLEAASGPQRSWAARGPIIEGEWDQIFTDNANAGTIDGDGTQSRRKLKGPISGRVQQVIEYDEPFGREIPPKFKYAQRARARYALGLQAEMRASVEAQPDGITWAVTFDTLTWSILGGRLTLRTRKLPPGGGGEWRTTYLDSDTRILRSKSSRGGPLTTYVLRKSVR